MRAPTAPRILRRTLVRHAALAVVVALVVSVLVTVGVVLSARQDAYRSAERIGRQIADAVIVSLARRDFTTPVDPPVRAGLLDDLHPFLGSGMASRVKVWTVDDGEARIAFSDQALVEGEMSRIPVDTVRRLDADEVVARPVPDDAEHRFETPMADSLLEVFIGFRDAGGHPARLELYVPVDEAGTVGHFVSTVLPLVLAGIVVLALATLPLSVTIARRVERERHEQRAVRRFGLAAAERSRRELARHLHDGVLPDLAGAAMLLDIARGGHEVTPPALLDQAHTLLTEEMRQLRGLLDDMVPATSVHEDLRAALLDVVARQRAWAPAAAPHVDIDVRGDPGDATAVIVHQVAGELVRNAFRHAGATHLHVLVVGSGGAPTTLTITDDGIGFDPERAGSAGHVGLLLVRRVLADQGGTLQVDSKPGAGTVITATVPPSAPLPLDVDR